MKKISVLLVNLFAASLTNAQNCWPPPDPEHLNKAEALLAEVPIIDGHNDLPNAAIQLFGGDQLARRERDQGGADADAPQEGCGQPDTGVTRARVKWRQKPSPQRSGGARGSRELPEGEFIRPRG